MTLSRLLPLCGALLAMALAPLASAQPLVVDDFENGIGPGEFVFGGGEFGALSTTSVTPDGSSLASQFAVDIDEFGGFTGWGQPIEGGPLDASGFMNPVVELDVAAIGTFEVEFNFQNTGGGGNGEVRSVLQFINGDGTYKTLRLPLSSFLPTNPAVFDYDDIAAYVFVLPPIGAMGDGDPNTQESVLRIDNVQIVEGPINAQTDLVANDFDSGDFSSYFFFAGGEPIAAAPTTDTPDGSANAFSGRIDGDEYGGFAGFGSTFAGAPLDASGFESYNFYLRTNGRARIEVNLQTVEGSGVFEARESFFVGDTGGQYELISIPLEALAQSGPNPPDFSQVINFVFTFVEVPGDGDPNTTEFAFDIDALGFGSQLGPMMGSPEIAVTPTSVNFGTVAVGSTAQRTVTITNEGDADLAVSSISVSGAAFSIVSGGVPGPIPAGGMQDVVVQFAPTASGSASGTLTIESDDADEATVTVALSGSGQVITGTCDYSFAAFAIELEPVPAGGGRVAFVYEIDNSANPNALTVDVWGITRNSIGTRVLKRPGRPVSVPANSVVRARYFQRMPSWLPADTYEYTLNAGTYDDLDFEESEICGSAVFTIVKEGDTLAGTTRTMTESDWATPEMEVIEIVQATSLVAHEVRVGPNPTRGAATFGFSLVEDADVTLAVFDVQGRTVATVLDGRMEAGAHTAALDSRLAPGVYVWQLRAGDRVETGRLMVVR